MEARASELELLLLRGQFEHAADASRTALEVDFELKSPAGKRILAVAFQSYWIQGKQQQLLEHINATYGGLQHIPLQAFVLWQVLQLDAGHVGDCQAQIEARLQRMVHADTSSGRSPEQSSACSTAAEEYPHVQALCKLYVLDLLCNELREPNKALSALDAPLLQQLLQDDDVQALQAEVAGQVLSVPAPTTPPQHTSPQPAAPGLQAYMGIGGAAQFCTMLGEPDDDSGDAGASPQGAVQQQGGMQHPSGKASAALRGVQVMTQAACATQQAVQGHGTLPSAHPPTRPPQGTQASNQRAQPPQEAVQVGSSMSVVATAEGAQTQAGAPEVPGSSGPPGSSHHSALPHHQQPTTRPVVGTRAAAGQWVASTAWVVRLRQWIRRKVALCVLNWEQASEVVQALLVALVLVAVYRERQVLLQWLTRPVSALGRHMQPLLSMGLALTPNPMTSGFMPAAR